MKILVVITALVVFSFVFDTVSGIASEFEEHEQDASSRESMSAYRSMIATAYCLNGTTASGTQTRRGIAAGKREWFGKTAKVYWNDNGTVGELIGEYIIEDTGSTPIKNGSVIDIWMPTRDECMDFGRRLVYVEIVD